jgi:cell shape-determining protein MreC
MEQSQGGQAVSVEERILFLAESPDCNHPRELRAIAFQVRKLEDRIKQLESENDALRADLLLWNEKEVKP